MDLPNVLDCTGSHYSMGVSQGVACRQSLQRLHKVLGELTGIDQRRMLASAFDRVGPRLAGVAGHLSKRLLAQHLQRNYPEQFERSQGIADGAKLPLHQLFLGPAVEYALNRTSYSLPRACTAVAITAERSDEGEAVIAKNFDYPDAGRDLYLARISRPGGLAASIDITHAPLCGSHEGVNEYGLAIAYNYGSFKGRPVARVTITNLVQEMLELCHTVTDAIEYIRGRPRSGGALLMLADAAGDIASVEVAPDRESVRRPGASGTLAHTNHALTREIKPFDIPDGAVFSRWYPKYARGLPVHRSSWRRLERAEALLATSGPIGRDQLIALLSDHNQQPHGDDDTICRHGPFYRTTCSVLLYPRRRAVEVMFGAPCDTDYHTVYLSESTTAEGKATETMAKFAGTVKRNQLEGGFWELHASNGERYQLRGGDDDLKVEGQKVEITGKVDKGGFGIGMTGPILDVKSWKKQ